LTQINVTNVQIGLQTVNPFLQEYMNRTFPVDRFKYITDLLRKFKIKFSLDIIEGLPNDNIDCLKNTLKYAISLKPQGIQLKQFFLNPNTLFFVEKNSYQIETESEERDFEVPYVLKASEKINEEYHKKAYVYIMENIKKNPQIKWRFLSRIGNYINLN